MRDAGITNTRFAFGLRKLMVVLVTTLFVYAAPAAIGGKPVKTGKDRGFKNTPTKKIAAEFRKIREIKGHFQGGEWNDHVDKWMGRKHQLMIELGVRLTNKKARKNDVLKLLGQPDQIAAKGDELFKRLTGQPGAGPPAAGTDEVLVYYWRGTHDLLFFNSFNGRIVDSGWWYAGE